MEPLSVIMVRLSQRIDRILSTSPKTVRQGDDIVTTYEGKEYKNLTFDQMNDLKRCAYDGAYKLWNDVREYERYLYWHFTPCADYYLQEMREQLR